MGTTATTFTVRKKKSRLIQIAQLEAYFAELSMGDSGRDDLEGTSREDRSTRGEFEKATASTPRRLPTEAVE